jgi:DNA-binding XRE family transcriptional regulator
MTIRDSNELGRVISSRRRQLRLTQEEIADLIGTHRRVIGELEQGKRTVQLRIVIDTCRVLGLDVKVDPRQ